MRKKFLAIAFCLFLLTSCQSNISSENPSTEAAVPETSIETTEAETTIESEPIELETETIQTEALTEPPQEPLVQKNIEIGDEITEVFNGVTTPEKTQIVLDMMTIDLSEPDSIQMSIQTVPIEHVGYELIDPVSPLIKIDAGGHFFKEPVVLSYPHDENHSSNPYAFFYNEEDDSIEMLPFIRNTSETQFFTSHFSNIFIAQLTPEMKDHLDERRDVITPFKIGTDDFSFVNRGSYAAPGGHCDGQSQAAMWYFKNIRLKNIEDSSTALYNLYDNNLNDFRTPDFWVDDSWLYRFASSVQKDERSGYIFGLLHLDTEINSGDGSKTDQDIFDAFYLSMLLTNRPQLIWVWTDDTSAGHALIAYAIKGNRLYVADPNYPGQERYIELADGAFKPYGSGSNFTEIAAGRGTNYTQFQFLGEFATIDEHQIETRWKEVTSGQLSNEYFPYFGVISKSGNTCINQYEFKIEPIDATPDDFRFTLYDKSLREILLTDATKTEVLSPPFNIGDLDYPTYVLQEIVSGENTIGVLIEGNSGPDAEFNWAGFQWIEIYNDTNLILKANKTSIKPGETATIAAEMESGIDISNQLEWLVENKVISYNSDSFDFSAEETGQYTVEAFLFNANLRKQITIEVTDNPIEPVEEIPESEASKVSGTYSCTFTLANYKTQPFTNFQDDPWYTADQKVQLAKESAARLEEAFSEKVGIPNIDRDNFRVTVNEDGTCSIGFSDFLGFNMAFYGVGPVPFNGGNVSFDITDGSKQYTGIIQFELTEDGAEMWGRVVKNYRDSQYSCYITATHEFEGVKVK